MKRLSKVRIFLSLLITIILIFVVKENRSKSEERKQALFDHARIRGINVDELEQRKGLYTVKSSDEIIALSRKRPDLQKLYYSNRSAIDSIGLPSELGGFSDLQYLGINSRHLHYLPAETSNLIELHSLYLNVENIKEIPAFIGEFKKLESLTIRALQKVDTLYSEVFDLPNLKRLELLRIHNNDIVIEEEAFERMPQLTYLQLQDTRAKIPKSIDHLVALDSLKLNSYYGELPPEIFNLDSLTYLNVGYVSIGELDGVGEMNSLKFFEIHNAAYLSSEIGRLTNLEELVVDEIRNDTFSDSFNNLERLRRIVIVEVFDLEKLPEFVFNQKDLEELVIAGCPNLKYLNSNFVQYDKLRKVRISGLPHLEALPDFIYELENLEELVISFCPTIKRIDPKVLELKKLKKILLVENESLIVPEKIRASTVYRKR